MSFPWIEKISDVQPFVADKKEIRFSEQPNGCTVGCYMFMDGNTFDTPQALECRGIAFDRSGRIVSRPLHKFFNVGEKPWLMPEQLSERHDVAAIQDKIDGSLIATAWIDGELVLRSRKSFTSDVVALAEEIMERKPLLREFASEVAYSGMTACFEITHPKARIVVDHGSEPSLRLLHVRANVSGEYVLLDPRHGIHELIAEYGVERVRHFPGDLRTAMLSLEGMKDAEGYVAQFDSGDMCKIKCPWYLRLHRSITFLRERSIAELALNEELDDTKSDLLEAGVDLAAVLAVESRLKDILIRISDEVDAIYEADKALDRKTFAIKHKTHPYFSMAMSRYIGRDPEVREWYRKHRLREDFGLDTLANEAQMEAVNG